MHSPRGFTLTELLTTMAVIGVLSTVAVPSFSAMRLNSGRTTAVNGFYHALFLARSESMKRGMVVSLCPSRNGQQCAPARTADWSGGYVVFVNTDRDDPAQLDADEPVLLTAGAWTGGRIASNRQTFSFRPYTQGVVNGTVVFCDSRGSAEARAIIISHTGRPRISPRDASNHPLSCS